MATNETGNYCDASRFKEHYERFYAHSDFKHFGWVDKVFVKALVQRYRLKGLNLLDLGCGPTLLFCERKDFEFCSYRTDPIINETHWNPPMGADYRSQEVTKNRKLSYAYSN